MRKTVRKHMNLVWRALLCLSLAAVVFWNSAPRAEASGQQSTEVRIALQEGTREITQPNVIYNAAPNDLQVLSLYLNDLFMVALDGANNMEYSFDAEDFKYFEVKADPSGREGWLSLHLYDAIPEYVMNKDIEEDKSSNDSGTCHHEYEWEVQREATPTESGLELFKCKRCGHVKTRLEVSGYMSFAREVADSISKAAVGETLIFNTEMWNSFPKIIIDAFSARKDVAVTINYKYEGKHYTVTIPAGADLTPLVNEEGYIGFRNLDAAFGGSEVEK